MANFHQGKFIPKNPHKYVGDVKNITHRSLWERRFMIWCDTNSSVTKWNSEELIVEYYSPIDNRVHRYHVDFLIEYIDSTGNKKKCAVEIKPAMQTLPPKPSRNKKRFIEELMTYAINQAKWVAADSFCKKRGIEFRVLTEYDLGIKRK